MISRETAFEIFKSSATNSSHFVWFLNSFQFWQAPNQGSILAYLPIGNIILLPLEPLMTRDGFAADWKVFTKEHPAALYCFVAVPARFQSTLRKIGFDGLLIAKEPWIQPLHSIPKGSAGKGVRAARNQAIRAGVTIEYWPGEEVEQDPLKKNCILEILENWKDQHLIEVDGFLNRVDPFTHASIRHYFIAFNADRTAAGFLIVTPVGNSKKYFLEDLILAPSAKRGTGELLTTEALEQISTLEGEAASLGVVSLLRMESDSLTHVSPETKKAFSLLLWFARRVYPTQGLETYRKRFKPSRWDPLYLSAIRGDGTAPKLSDWMRVAIALIRAFRPKIRLSWRAVHSPITDLLNAHPISISFLTISTFLFWKVNHFGNLQQWSYFCALVWLEKTENKSFYLPFILGLHFFDDFFNYFLLHQPFRFLAFQDVGGSLELMTVLGYQIYLHARKNKEWIFISLLLGVTLTLIFGSRQFTTLVSNAEHLIFLVLGYLIGKIRLDQLRKISHKTAKGKSPLLKPKAKLQ